MVTSICQLHCNGFSDFLGIAYILCGLLAAISEVTSNIDKPLFIGKSKNCQWIPPETSIVYDTLSSITELTQLNIFALKIPPWVPSMIVSNRRS